MLVKTIFFIIYILPIYDCYLNTFYTYKKNVIKFKLSSNNINLSYDNNKKLYDDYSNFLNNNKKKNITYIDLYTVGEININEKVQNSYDNTIVIYNSNTARILANFKEILKY